MKICTKSDSDHCLDLNVLFLLNGANWKYDTNVDVNCNSVHKDSIILKC